MMTSWTEDELNGMSIRDVYSKWKEAGEDDRNALSEYMLARLNTVIQSEDFSDVEGEAWSEYDLAAAIKVAYSGNETAASDDLKRIVNMTINNVKDDSRLSSLQKSLRMNALIEAQAVLTKKKSNPNNGRIVANALSAKKASELLPEEIKDFDDADNTGGLDNVDPAVVAKLRQEIAKLANFSKVNGKNITINDSVLASVIGGLDNEHLFDKIKVKFNFAEGKEGEAGYVKTSDEQAKKLEKVLKHNAALRATYDALADKKFYDKYKSYLEIEDKGSAEAKEMAGSIMEYFQDKIAENYQRSLVLARITTLDSDDLLQNVKINRKTGRASYKEDDEHIAGIVNEVADATSEGGVIELNPHTVGMDAYDMELENALVSQALKTKNVFDKAKEKMKFFKGVKAGWKQAMKDGGWKRVLSRGAVNFGIFGLSAAAMSTGSAALIVPGAAAYAGWTWVNAKMMPIYDHIKAKLRNGKKLSRKERRQYIKNNWKANKEEVYKQTRFKKRSDFRVKEGAVVAGVAGITSFFAGPWWSRLARQTTMLGGKGITLGQTAVAEKKSKEQYLEDGHRRLAQYKEIQALKGQKTQDIVTLTAVVAGAAYVDSGAAASVNSAIIGALGLEDEVASIHNLLTGNKGANNATDQADETATANVAPTQEGDDSTAVTEGGEQSAETETAPEPFDPNTLSADDRAAYYRVLDRWGEERLNTILGKMEQDGKIIDAHGREFDMPEGMSKFKVAEAFYYLSHWNAKNPNAKILGYLFYNDCDGKDTLAQYSPEQINTAINVLRAIDLGPDHIRTVMADGCPVETHTHGHIDIDKYNQITGSHARAEYHLVRGKVAYDPCDGSLKGTFVRLASPCAEEPVIDQPVVDQPVVEIPVKIVEPQHFTVAASGDIHFESQIPGTADEVQISSNGSDMLHITKPEAAQSMTALHSDVADSLRASDEVTVEQLQAIDNMLVEKKKFLGFIPYTVRHGSVNIDAEHPERSTIEFAGSWKPEGVDADNTSVGTVRMTAQAWQESLNGNYGTHAVAQNIDGNTLVANADNIHYSHSANGNDYYTVNGMVDKKGNDVRFYVPTPTHVNTDASTITGANNAAGDRVYTCQAADGNPVYITLNDHTATFTDKGGNNVSLYPNERNALAQVVTNDCAGLSADNPYKGATFDFNPPSNSPQAAYEHSRWPNDVKFDDGKGNTDSNPTRFYPGRYGQFTENTAGNNSNILHNNPIASISSSGRGARGR